MAHEYPTKNLLSARACLNLSLLRLKIARSTLFSPTCSGILLLFDIVGAEEEDVAEDDDEISFIIGEFDLRAAE